MSQPIREVDPGDLRLPPSRAGGADPWKLHQQIRQFGSSTAGMPPIFVYEPGKCRTHRGDAEDAERAADMDNVSCATCSLCSSPQSGDNFIHCLVFSAISASP